MDHIHHMFEMNHIFFFLQQVRNEDSYSSSPYKNNPTILLNYKTLRILKNVV